ncbi:ATP-grasp domain-containing protein [Pseudonocardia sp. NPDC046786]|uniref:ATP-grasp domain-containing protein n=1 Tax=Pseudonocardia sp. NPDC046786 TaxID=3155471 RepID=UPI0033C71ABC
MTVLVLTNRMDATADVAIDVLNRRRNSVIRADIDELTVAAELSGSTWEGWISARGRTADLQELTGIYYRRPSPVSAPEGYAPEVARWIREERHWGLRGLLFALPRRRWLSWPPAVHAAEHKPHALARAADAGLTVPRTMITNDPDPARVFTGGPQPTLYKSFRGGGVSIRSTSLLTYATEITSADIGDSVRAAPITLQERIDKICDVRVTCVDDEVFGVTPHRAGTIPLDWRDDHGANDWSTVTVPDDVRDAVASLMNDLGLRFCAADFALDRDGRWHHLDLNPAGQWAWDHPACASIAESLADALTRKDMPHDPHRR